MPDDALFEYAITPAAVPAGQTAKFTVTVTNATGDAVKCSGIAFEFPHDASAGFLTDDTAGIGLGVLAPASWQLTQQDEWTFVAQPVGAASGLGVDEVLGLVFDKVAVDSTPATVDLVVTESTGAVRTAQIPVKKTQQQVGITDFTASALFLAPGDPVTISWTAFEATGCTLTWEGADYDGKADDSHTVEELWETTPFTLTADGEGAPASQQLTVTVARPTINNFDFNPTAVAAGGQVMLTWDTIHSQAVTLQDGNSKPEPVAPSNPAYAVNPLVPTDFYLRAQGSSPDSGDRQSVHVVVEPVVASFSASPPVVIARDPSTLSWATEWSTGCSISGIGPVAPTSSGSTVVNPQADSSYTLQAAGYQPQTVTASVWVAPTITSLVITNTGPWIEIDWETTGVSSLLSGQTPAGPGVWPGVAGDGSVTVEAGFEGRLVSTGATGATATIALFAQAGGDGNAQLIARAVDGNLDPIPLNGGTTTLVDWSSGLGSPSSGDSVSTMTQRLPITSPNGQANLTMAPAISESDYWVTALLQPYLSDPQQPSQVVFFGVHRNQPPPGEVPRGG